MGNNNQYNLRPQRRSARRNWNAFARDIININEIVKALLPLLGGKDNIVSAAHCATRLCLLLADDSLVQKSAIEKLDGVKGCFSNAGQLQVIFGTGLVNKVYAEFIKVADVNEASKSEAADAAARKLNPFQRIARLLSNIFVPIIPAIVASGLLMGLLGMVKTYGCANGKAALQMPPRCPSAVPKSSWISPPPLFLNWAVH
ncbi:Sucrose permease IIC component [Yersinia aldovae ATCC 35236]|uniref:PTSsystem sucrose-specific transporter subunit IIBC n=1 Tax=Yersinia aldovae TaxID=29483 RepID=A0A0T9TXB2_YERAL|nr:Sucrose permease IIC component [Yersinia aldovae ATCC 35236]CNL07187.1 PTSsystem sucrose-specific transporter subunit IIBC [Yersinia aldovae]